MSFYPDGTPIYDDADEAYEPDDPKSERYVDAMLDWADMERKRRKEDGPEDEAA